MNRTAAITEVAAWKLIIADTSSKTVERNAVRALVAAAEWWQAEAERLAEQTRADQADNVELQHALARQNTPGQRPPKSYTNDTDAIEDARKRGNCSVFRTDLTNHAMFTPGRIVTTFWSVPIEQSHRDGILCDRWRHATPVEPDQAQPLVRPATPDTPQPPAELPRRAS